MLINHQIKLLEQRVAERGIPNLGKAQIRYALWSKYADGDLDKAFELLMILEDSIEGVLRDYAPSVKLLGAENREGVTCYLDALLFAMFARLDCFEAILYNSFDDDPRRNLAVILRLWVNMLRSGKLITTDLVSLARIPLWVTHILVMQESSPNRGVITADSHRNLAFVLVTNLSMTDKTSPRRSRRVRMDRCSKITTAGCVRSLHIYHGKTGASTPHIENGYLSYGERRYKRGSQVRQ